MSRTKMSLATLWIIVAGMTICCRKSDTIRKATDQVDREPAFFATHPSSSPAVLGVQQFLKSREKLHPFIEEFVKRAGLPYWDRALVYTGRGMQTESGGESATIVYVPFVRDSQSFVNTMMAVRMSQQDTQYRVVSNWQYADFGFDSTRTDTWTARDIFNIFSAMDKAVFGYRSHRVKDGRIFGKAQDVKLKVTEAAQGPGTEDFSLVCSSKTVCITAGYATNSYQVETECTTSTECFLVWSGGGGNAPGGGSGGGTGGGGNSGGSGGGSGGLPPECPVTNSIGVVPEAGTINPCDTSGWVPMEIVNNVQDSCIRDMVEEILSKDCRNEISAFINQTFANTDDVMLYIYDARLGAILGLDARTSCAPITNTTNQYKITITLNSSPGALNGASTEYIAITFFHEAIHAWIELTMPDPIDEAEAHNLMVSQQGIARMTTALREMFPHISQMEAEHLAWGGMQQTTAWAAMPQARKDSINQTNQEYRTLQKGTPCFQ